LRVVAGETIEIEAAKNFSHAAESDVPRVMHQNSLGRKRPEKTGLGIFPFLLGGTISDAAAEPQKL
jgi:hypothetical protein